MWKHPQLHGLLWLLTGLSLSSDLSLSLSLTQCLAQSSQNFLAKHCLIIPASGWGNNLISFCVRLKCLFAVTNDQWSISCYVTQPPWTVAIIPLACPLLYMTVVRLNLPARQISCAQCLCSVRDTMQNCFVLFSSPVLSGACTAGT